jgi:Lrp/AsnC family transcriptional regulator, leucine-responsive regulatory protein
MNVINKLVILDQIDKKIILLLKRNARNSVSKIAELINLSVPATSDRIKKLEDSDIIQGYKAKINSRRIGLDLKAFITIISESSSNYEKIIDFVNKTDEIIECLATTGRGSHILIVETQNTSTLEKLLRTIQSWPNVIRTETQIILSENKKFINLKKNNIKEF